jgi:5-(carboxyamino)imidazole ribonucleotide synthase
MNAYNVSQFESHIRAVCDLSVKTPKKIRNVIMYNILGEDIKKFRGKELNKNEFFYDYGKSEIKDKRKMGHLNKIY